MPFRVVPDLPEKARQLLEKFVAESVAVLIVKGDGFIRILSGFVEDAERHGFRLRRASSRSCSKASSASINRAWPDS